MVNRVPRELGASTACSPPDAIVVGFSDRSGGMGRALWEAALWAARRQVDIMLVTCVDRHHRTGSEASEGDRQRRHHALYAVNGAAYRLATSTDVSQQVHTAVVEQPAVDALVAASATAGLIVLQHRRLGTVARLRAGSTTAAVVARAGCAVLVVHADDQIAVQRGILVALDRHEPDDRVLFEAFEESSRRGVPLTAVHLARGPTTMSAGRTPVSSSSVRAADDLADHLAGWQLRYPDVGVRRAVLGEPSLAGVLALAEDCDLLVVTRARAGHPTSPRLDAMTRRIITEAPCPVLVTPPAAEGQRLLPLTPVAERDRHPTSASATPAGSITPQIET
ncbi:MAG TPA: universal stress protein [Microlunatus sp.]